MSDESYKQLVGRLATEPEFAAWVRAHPDGLAHPSFGFDLTSQEAASLVALAAEGGAEPAAAATAAAPAALETRRSKSGVAAGGAAAAAAGAAGGGYYLYKSSQRSYSGARYSLELGGKSLGQVYSVEGGFAEADVVTEKLGPSKFAHKHVANLHYEDLSLEIGLDLGPSIYDWITQTWQARPVRRDGSVVAADLTGKSVSQLDFHNGLISEVGFPALDASSKDAAKMTLKITPEYTRGSPPKAGAPKSGVGPGPQKNWSPSNFRLKLDGLDTSRVTRIEPFTVKQVYAADRVGSGGGAGVQPSYTDVPSLRVTLPTSAADSWLQWHADFVIKGNSGHDREKNGSLHFLAADLKTELGRLELKGLGIFKIGEAPLTAGGDTAARVIADLYCTTMDLHVGAPAAAATAEPSTSPTATPTSTPTASPTTTPTHAPISPSPSPSVTPQPTPSATPSALPAASPTATHLP